MHVHSRKKKTEPLTRIYQQNLEKEKVKRISVLPQPLITFVLFLMLSFFLCLPPTLKIIILVETPLPRVSGKNGFKKLYKRTIWSMYEGQEHWELPPWQNWWAGRSSEKETLAVILLPGQHIRQMGRLPKCCFPGVLGSRSYSPLGFAKAVVEPSAFQLDVQSNQKYKYETVPDSSVSAESLLYAGGGAGYPSSSGMRVLKEGEAAWFGQGWKGRGWVSEKMDTVTCSAQCNFCTWVRSKGVLWEDLRSEGFQLLWPGTVLHKWQVFLMQES